MPTRQPRRESQPSSPTKTKAWRLGFECCRLHPLHQLSSSQPLVTPPPLLDPSPTLIRAHFLDRCCSRRTAASASARTCYFPGQPRCAWVASPSGFGIVSPKC